MQRQDYFSTMLSTFTERKVPFDYGRHSEILLRFDKSRDFNY
jgi:hypothetical protein